jgi:hypothetical protein
LNEAKQTSAGSEEFGASDSGRFMRGMLEAKVRGC